MEAVQYKVVRFSVFKASSDELIRGSGSMRSEFHHTKLYLTAANGNITHIQINYPTEGIPTYYVQSNKLSLFMVSAEE